MCPSDRTFFTRLKPKRKLGLLALLGIHRKPEQKYFLKSSKGFLRAVLTGHGLPGPL